MPSKTDGQSEQRAAAAPNTDLSAPAFTYEYQAPPDGAFTKDQEAVPSWYPYHFRLRTMCATIPAQVLAALRSNSANETFAFSSALSEIARTMTKGTLLT